MLMIMGLDGFTHIADPADHSTALCGEPLCGADAVNPAVAVPVTHDGCRIVNGRRIRAAMHARTTATTD